MPAIMEMLRRHLPNNTVVYTGAQNPAVVRLLEKWHAHVRFHLMGKVRFRLSQEVGYVHRWVGQF